MPLPTSDSVFKRLSKLVRARDILTPFAMICEEQDRVIDVLKELKKMGRLGDPVLVRCDWGIDVYSSPGAIDLESRDEDGSWLDGVDDEEDTYSSMGALVWETRKEFNNAALLSADVPLFELLHLFISNDAPRYFVVIDGKDFAGVVRYSDVMKPPGRVCLFSLTLELEFAALSLCGDSARECFDVLSPERRKKAKAVFKHRYGGHVNFKQIRADRKRHFGKALVWQLLLDCTTFVDKATMISKRKLVRKDHFHIQSVFARAEKLRNACAHPALVDDAAPLPLPELVALVNDCHDLITAFTDERSRKEST